MDLTKVTVNTCWNCEENYHSESGLHSYMCLSRRHLAVYPVLLQRIAKHASYVNNSSKSRCLAKMLNGHYFLSLSSWDLLLISSHWQCQLLLFPFHLQHLIRDSVFISAFPCCFCPAAPRKWAMPQVPEARTLENLVSSALTQLVPVAGWLLWRFEIGQEFMLRR